MFDQSESSAFALTNARLILPDRVVHGSISVEGASIASTSTGAVTGGIDMDGDVITPGVVDLHTDHAETHVFPRQTVQWDFLNALMAYDAQIIGSGTTTVFDSLSVGASMRRPERRAILAPLLDAIETGQSAGLFRSEHFVHLRCEICDPETMALVDANMEREICRVASVMDHTPGDRQTPDMERWLRFIRSDMGLDDAAARKELDDLLDRSARVGAEVRAHVVARAKACGLPMMSHDDRTEEQTDQAVAEGMTISEFPTTLAAARRARQHGLAIIAGAPNYLRGGSQSGNIAVRELLAENLVDMLTSDYVPRSPIDAAFAIAEDETLPQTLPETIAMVSARPAAAAGLTDRGTLAPGQRADLLRIRRVDGRTHIRSVWRAGRRVL